MEYSWLIFGVIALLAKRTNGQVYIFQTIEDHNQRLTAVESTIANMTMCCNVVRNENEWLKQVTANLTSMLKSLTKEVELLKSQSKSGASSTTVTQQSSAPSKQTRVTTMLMTPTSTLLPTPTSSSQPTMTPTSIVQPKSTFSVSTQHKSTPTSTVLPKTTPISSLPKSTPTSVIQPNSNQSKATPMTPTRTSTSSTTHRKDTVINVKRHQIQQHHLRTDKFAAWTRHARFGYLTLISDPQSKRCNMAKECENYLSKNVPKDVAGWVGYDAT
ncbi:hypothetical protein FSP39_012672 [Pinctada imbricata]|uniref:Uncharacterized protein n=1 Tax=Pinctada imbricata TaxID=66713 RepID=A0AA89BUN0_PINIB|nr:hypothetical protein FSP39_012672 [Pinctada imbricata]